MNSGKFCVKNVDTASISDAADSLYMSEGWLSSIVPRTPGSHAIVPLTQFFMRVLIIAKTKNFVMLLITLTMCLLAQLSYL